MCERYGDVDSSCFEQDNPDYCDECLKIDSQIEDYEEKKRARLFEQQEY